MRSQTCTTLAALALCVTTFVPSVHAATLKKIVAVSRFDNKTAYSSAAIGDGMADQLTDALMQSGQFTVMERQNIKDVIKEEDFANSGRVQKAKSAKPANWSGRRFSFKARSRNSSPRVPEARTGLASAGSGLATSIRKRTSV